MIFEKTEDTKFVTQCLTDPAVWRMGSDDGLAGVNPGLFFIQNNNEFWLKSEYGVLIGRPVNMVTYDVHVALLPHARGIAVDVCKAAIAWMFENTRSMRLVASIPEFNRLAIRLANQVGMEFIGNNKKSFMKNGVLVDQLMFGISKEIKTCHS